MNTIHAVPFAVLLACLPLFWLLHAHGICLSDTVPQGCSESTVASVNSDGITCGGGPIGYNANNGGWLRAGTFDKGITNQSSIDLSPAVNKALGWVYPSSGLINVNVSALP